MKIEVMVGLGAIAPGVFTTGTEVSWGIGVAVLVHGSGLSRWRWACPFLFGKGCLPACS